MRRTLILPTALLISTLALTGCSAGMNDAHPAASRRGVRPRG